MRKRKQPFYDRGHALSIEGTCNSDDARFKIHGLLPGERALIQPLKKQRGAWICQSSEHEDLHPARVIPPCRHASICGGCAFQHVARSEQLGFKQHWLSEIFKEQPPAQWLATIKGRDSGYRSKARLGVKFVEKKQTTLIGFREVGSALIAEIDSCTVLIPELAGLLAPLRRLVDQLASKKSIPQIEVAASEEQVALVVRHLVPLDEADIAHLKAFERDYDVIFLLQSKGPASVVPLSLETTPLLKYSLPEQNLTFSFHPMDFTQVNQEINQHMVSQAIALLSLEPTDQVLDAFCGIGNFSLPIAQRVSQVWGLEAAENSIHRARENALANGLGNVQFYTVDLYNDDISAAQLPPANKVLLDPPRSGAEHICRQLLNHGNDTIVYVSCNPVSLRRDADILVGGGYRLEVLGMIDMFPHTAHMESIAKFTRATPNG